MTEDTRPRAIAVRQNAVGAFDRITLDHEARFRRRIGMTTDGGLDVLLDLASATELHPGQGLVLDDGRVLEVCAADEALMEARTDDPHLLLRAAWHVGNRHLPCRILPDRLVLRFDHVIADMLRGLGCAVVETEGPFLPEGGAYGAGRTHGHSH